MLVMTSFRKHERPFTSDPCVEPSIPRLFNCYMLRLRNTVSRCKIYALKYIMYDTDLVQYRGTSEWL